MSVPAEKPPVKSRLQWVVDGWSNIITGIGTAARDKRLGARVSTPPASTQWQDYENLYLSDDIARTVVETPSQEMVKTWISVSADQEGGAVRPDIPLSDPQLQLERKDAASQQIGNSVLLHLESIQAQTRVFEALVWAQVFGGSIMFLGCDDGGGANANMAEPLREDRIQSFNFLSVFDRWDVDVYTWYRDLQHPKFGLPESYRIRQTMTPGGSISSVPEQIVHETRAIRFDGAMVNRRRRVKNAGWADSVYIRLADVIRDFAMAYGGVANLMTDFAQATFKMKGLAEALMQDNDALVLKRIALMDMARSVGRCLPIDAESEEFTRTVTPVTGMPDLLDRLSLRLAAAARMPVTLLMGDSPSGMNATGDSDISWFFDHIRSRQEKELRPILNRLIKLVFLSKNGPTAGKVPAAWNFAFNPLWQASEAEMAKNRNVQAQTDQIYMNSGAVSPHEVAMSRFGGDRYSYETVIDPTQDREKEPKTAAAATAEFGEGDDKQKPSQKGTPKGDN